MAGLRALGVALALFLAYSTVESYMVGNNPYHRVETLDLEGKYILEWIVDWESKRITFNVSVETLGYVGFGLSSYGKMSGADIVIGGVKRDGSSYFSDRHAIDHEVPVEDPSQDWILESAREDGTHTYLSFSRDLDTCDPQDYPITEDKIELIWAYGERDTIRHHHGERGGFPVHLLDPDYTPKITVDPRTGQHKVEGQSNIVHWQLKPRLELPERDHTTYWCTIYKGPRLSRKHHLAGFEVALDERGRKHVHHIIVQRCHAPEGKTNREVFDQWTRHPGQHCFLIQVPEGPMPTEYCTDYAMGWVIGGRIYWNPPDVGHPMIEDPDEYYMLQTHYDNKDFEKGIVAKATLNFYLTPKLRQHDVGIMNFRTESPGLPPTQLVPPYSTDSRAYGICSSSCTQKYFPKEGVEIVALFLHSHDSGRRMVFQHFRNGKELPWIASDDNYSNQFQQLRTLNRRVRVLPGDTLVMRCSYDNTWTNGTVVPGFSTRQEMCAAWFVYHNKVPNHQVCTATINSPDYREHFLGVRNVTWSQARIEWVVDPPHRLAGLTITEVSDRHVNWNLERREQLERFHLLHPWTNICRTEVFARDRFEDYSAEDAGVLVKYPAEIPPYQPSQSCSFKQK